MLWGRVKEWLKGTCLSKRWQARVVEACVESSLLYDCQARVWYKRDIRKLQQWMDRCYRYVWSDRNGEPLRQMEERGVNMQDVRNRLGVKSVSWKIEKRVLERIGHVIRMGNERLTKAVVLGWYERLEGCEKMKGKKKKTVLFWKRLMKEAGWDWTNVERLANDRKGWKRMVQARMEHLYEWERQHGHEYVWEEGEERLRRSERVVCDLGCKYDGCVMVCRTRAALTVHQKRLHRAAEERKRFKCGTCEKVLETEGARMNHERMCMGERVREDGRIECWCGKVVSRANVNRHRRFCGVLEVLVEEREEMNENANEQGMEEGREERMEGEVNELDRGRGEEEEEEEFGFLGFEDDDRRVNVRVEEREEVLREMNEREDEVREDRVEGVANGNEREREEYDFRGFEENERRGRELNWFGGFEEDERGAHGMIGVAGLEDAEERERMNGEMNGIQADEGMNEIAQGRVNAEAIEGVDEGEIGGVARDRVFRGKRVECRLCGGIVSHSNLARHERTHRRVWDPGGGPNPQGGR